MSAFFGSIVGNVISFLEWVFYSMPTAVWFVLAAVAVGLGVWAMGNDEFSEIVSDSRTLPNGRQEVVIKCSEYDDEPKHIPLPNKVYVRHKPKK